MKSCTELLFELRQLVQSGAASSPEKQAAIAQLQKKVPPPVLAHYDRLVACGRNGVAVVRHGVCGECHMRLPVGTAASLLRPDDVHLCEHCGCYLLLAPDESAAESPPPAVVPAAPRRHRRERVAAAV